MCGIVGLHLKRESAHQPLGAHLAEMLDCMTTRGPDSAGIALYADPLPGGRQRYSVRLPEHVDAAEVARRAGIELGDEVAVESLRPDGAALVAAGAPEQVSEAILTAESDAVVVGHGTAIEMFKDVGSPRSICDRYGIAQRSAYQGVGHTRMATESAVTTDGSHPFAVASDLVLVHNGAFSNYATVRRKLEREGIRCVTDNDSEVCARYVAWQMSRGADLEDALRMVLKELDGFYTLLVSTADEFAVVRDSFACKPAVIAENDDYVAFGSEFHALASLPDVGKATVFEPMPEEIHIWRRGDGRGWSQ
ncbi:MAG: glutamine amidotransferase [Streptosporangiales bacterium]|nr:glutamine amidotransferase [Streptosporangiales bacterium]